MTRRRDDATEELPSLLRQASRAMDHLLRQTFERHGLAELTLTGHDVLVAARGGRPVVALADRLGLTPQAVSQAVGVLERAGLVEKDRHPLDRRAVLVRITGRGADVVDQARKAIIDALDVVADDVVEGRLPALADDLTRIARVDHEPDPWGLALS